jgi:hypothetical protein
MMGHIRLRGIDDDRATDALGEHDRRQRAHRV